MKYAIKFVSLILENAENIIIAVNITQTLSILIAS